MTDQPKVRVPERHGIKFSQFTLVKEVPNPTPHYADQGFGHMVWRCLHCGWEFELANDATCIASPECASVNGHTMDAAIFHADRCGPERLTEVVPA